MYIVFRSQENLINLKNSLFEHIGLRPEDYPSGLWFSGDEDVIKSSALIPIDIEVSKNIECAFMGNTTLTIYSKHQNMRRAILERKDDWSFYQWLVACAVELSIFEE